MSKSWNEVKLIGNLGKAPEVRQYGERSKATVSLATSETWRDASGVEQARTDWHRVVFWNGLAGLVQQYCSKGSRIMVSGQLRTHEFEVNGERRWLTEVVCRDMLLLDGRRGTGDDVALSTCDEPLAASRKGNGQDADPDSIPF